MITRYYFIFSFVILVSSFAQSQILFTASLNGSQETPAVTTPASGTAWAVLNSDKSITYSVTYANLSAPFTAGHFHAGAIGVAGGVVMPLTFTGNTAMGTWSNIPDSIIAKLFAGDLYVNVHSTGHPSGEIRGQFSFVDGIGFTSTIEGSQEVPPVVTNGSGTGYAIIENNGSQISYRFTVAGLSSNVTAAHFHYSPTGVNGPVLEALNFSTDSTATGTWITYPDSILVQMLRNNIYFNIHTTNNPSGEMRGQMIHRGEVLFTAKLNGSEEVPPVSTAGLGTGWCVLMKDNKSIYYRETFAQLSAPFSAGHIHVGAVGTNGPVIKPLTFNGNSAEGSYSDVPDSLLAQFIKGNTYMNVHTTANPGGEIRGQLMLSAGIGYVAILDGANETPPVTTNANGTGFFVWGAPVPNTLNSQVTIAGLSSALTAAHFHFGPAGVAGPVVFPIDFGADSTTDITWNSPPDTSLTDLEQGNIYMNVHSSNNPGGEIRGQLIYTNLISGSINAINDQASNIPENYILNQNYPNPFNPSTTISYVLPNTSDVRLTVYDILGRQVDILENQVKPAGSYKVIWTPRNLSSGVYFYRLEAGSFIMTKKLMLLK